MGPRFTLRQIRYFLAAVRAGSVNRAAFELNVSAAISQIEAICSAHRVPVIPFGAGSSLEGQIIAINGGLSLDLPGMTRILAVDAADMDCHVECGVTRQRLDDELRATGLFFPVGPGAHATLGGMAAIRASGTTTVRCGSMRDLVMGLTVVLPDGRIVRTGGRARKSASGDDQTLRPNSRPALRQPLLAGFPDLESAADTVAAAPRIGPGVNRIEPADA